jgi:uncharacterized protein (TIGR02147 family)
MDLEQFTDYREYLRAAVARQKAQNPLWSYASFARALGLKSAASIHKIVVGRRDPSPELTARLAGYFAFSARERARFLDLVLTQRTGKRAVKPAAAPLSGDLPARTLTEAEFEAVSGWWYYAIRQMSRWRRFQKSPAWIQQRLLFPVRRVAIRRALSVMTDLGLFDAKNGISFAGGERGSAALRRFHAQMLANAAQALTAMTPAERWVNGLTLAMSRGREAEAREVLSRFVRDFNERFSADGADAVYQLNLQYFPLAREGGGS